MLAARRSTLRSPLLAGIWPVLSAVKAASQSMLASRVEPSLMLVPVGDEPAGEVLTVRPGAAVDQQAGAGFEGMMPLAQARSARREAGRGRRRSRSSFRSGRGGDGAACDVGERGHAELDGLALAAQGGVDLGELVLGAGEADLEALDLAEPALALGFVDAVVQVGPPLCRAGGAESGSAEVACSVSQSASRTPAAPAGGRGRGSTADSAPRPGRPGRQDQSPGSRRAHGSGRHPNQAD